MTFVCELTQKLPKDAKVNWHSTTNSFHFHIRSKWIIVTYKNDSRGKYLRTPTDTEAMYSGRVTGITVIDHALLLLWIRDQCVNGYIDYDADRLDIYGCLLDCPASTDLPGNGVDDFLLLLEHL